MHTSYWNKSTKKNVKFTNQLGNCVRKKKPLYKQS